MRYWVRLSPGEKHLDLQPFKQNHPHHRRQFGDRQGRRGLTGQAWRHRHPHRGIQPGDRFQATLDCHVDVVDCNLKYYLFFEAYRSKTVSLGEWQLTDDQRMVDIDIDLSHFSGRLVTFMFWTINSGSDQAEQIALWINPRIETVK